MPAPSFRDVYDEHFPFVWRTLRRLGVPEADVPDAAQEVFVVVHRKLVEFEGRSKLSTWLFGIALRVAQARRSSAHARHEIATDAASLEGRADERVPAGAGAEGLAATLEHVLDQLSLEQRSVFVLFELEELSGDEIAELLGLPVGTVRSRLRLARDAFRRAAARLQARQQFRAVAGARS